MLWLISIKDEKPRENIRFQRIWQFYGVFSNPLKDRLKDIIKNKDTFKKYDHSQFQWGDSIFLRYVFILLMSIHALSAALQIWVVTFNILATYLELLATVTHHK